MRIDTPLQNSQKSPKPQASTLGLAAPFSRNDIRSDDSSTHTPDRMFHGDVNHVTSMLGIQASESPTCFRDAYRNTINRHAIGDMPNCIRYSHGRFMFIDIDKGVVRLGFDPATYKTKPSMTLGPGGALTHSKKISNEECKLMAASLHMASRNSLMYL
ncbi:hypothetical protein ACSFA3_12100 [Variovorax sp. RHLX14]|uniref:hypothetical protein n=1 Tax=Variovorax sp. RHLX14 TaxID=1259731 RepID=UPI003F464326